VRDSICDEHGEVEGIIDLRIKAIVDDGTGAVDVLINKDLSEKILGKTLKQYQDMAQEAMDYESVYDEIANCLLFMPVEVKGDSLSSDFIVTIYATDIRLLSIDVKKEADAILADLGDMHA
jgi:replication factor A1